jgi:hypothetical protein
MLYQKSTFAPLGQPLSIKEASIFAFWVQSIHFQNIKAVNFMKLSVPVYGVMSIETLFEKSQSGQRDLIQACPMSRALTLCKPIQ